MKKFLTFILAACFTFSAGALLTACEEGFSEAEWNEALKEENFDNVTVHYTIEAMGQKQVHTVKIADDLVYRSMTMFGETDEVYFTEEDALEQKNAFTAVFLSLLESRDNYEYDDGVYVNEEEIKVTVTVDGCRDDITMKDGEVKFDENGNLEYFTCTLTETIYDRDGNREYSYTAKSTWNFADYGKTVIVLPEGFGKEEGGEDEGVVEEENGSDSVVKE